MEEKLRRLMKQEGLNSTRLAEMLGIQASGISHIMSGRNKPSYDFIVKLLHRFPQINPDWLLSDKGPMYRNEIKSKNPMPQSPMFSSAEAASGDRPSLITEDLFSSKSELTRQEQNIRSLERDEDIIPSEGPSSARGKLQEFATDIPEKYSAPAAASAIELIIVFYKDKTFTEYRPG